MDQLNCRIDTKISDLDDRVTEIIETGGGKKRLKKK